jgi:hypothetical protein
VLYNCRKATTHDRQARYDDRWWRKDFHSASDRRVSSSDEAFESMPAATTAAGRIAFAGTHNDASCSDSQMLIRSSQGGSRHPLYVPHFCSIVV